MIRRIVAIWVSLAMVCGFIVIGDVVNDITHSVRAIMLYVNETGSGGVYTCIQDAIDASSDGDTVFVYSGTYYENVNINKTINLIGEDIESSIIDGGGIGDVVYIDADRVSITSFKIVNGGAYWEDGGIDINSDNNSIFNNNLSQSRNGIRISSSANNDIYCNIFIDNEDGISLDSSSYTNIYENQITLCEDHGIIGDSSSYNIIETNNITDNDIGIDFFGEISTNNEVMDNIITRNRYGLMFSYPTKDNLIHHNYLINNTSNAGDWGSNKWDNKRKGNYWDDYDGEDHNRNGVGDTEYEISYGNVDRYPLIWSIAALTGPIIVDESEEIDFGVYDATFNDGRIIIKSWDFDKSDGIQEDATGEDPKHTYYNGGIYTVTLRLKNARGFTTKDNLSVYVKDALLINFQDNTEDVVNENDETVGGHPDIDISEVSLWKVGDFLLYEMSVVGKIQETTLGSEMYIYTLYIFMDESDDIDDVDDADFTVIYDIESSWIENAATQESIDLDAYGLGTSTIMVIIPLWFIGNKTQFKINSVNVIYIGFSIFTGSYEEAYLDWLTDVQPTGLWSDLQDLCVPLVIGAIIVAIVAIVIIVKIKKKKSTTQRLQSQQYYPQQYARRGYAYQIPPQPQPAKPPPSHVSSQYPNRPRPPPTKQRSTTTINSTNFKPRPPVQVEKKPPRPPVQVEKRPPRPPVQVKKKPPRPPLDK